MKKNQMKKNQMKIERTTPPSNYFAPNNSDIAHLASLLDISVYSSELVRDLANVAAGGIVNPPSHWHEAVAHVADATLPPPDEDGDWSVIDGNGVWETTDDRDEAVEYRTKMLGRYHQNVCDFISTVKFHNVPGASPIAKALCLLKILSLQNDNQYRHYPDGMDTSADADKLPIFFEKGQQEANEINDFMEDISDMDELEELLVRHGQSDHGHPGLKGVAIAEDMAEGRHLWLKVSRKLKSLSRMRVSRMRVSRSKEFVPDVEGSEVRTRPIQSLNELDKLRPAEWTYPKQQRRVRIATRNAMMRERGKYEEKQQLLYMIIDGSGSMKGDPIHKAGGVLMNRLKSVVQGDAVVYCRLFDTELYDEHYASNKEEALKLIEEFRKENFSGGGTAIAHCAMEANQRIEELMKNNEQLTRPELVIVTDGDDRCGMMTAKDFHPTRVHAFVVNNTNLDLIEFAKSTGGVGIGDL